MVNSPTVDTGNCNRPLVPRSKYAGIAVKNVALTPMPLSMRYTEGAAFAALVRSAAVLAVLPLALPGFFGCGCCAVADFVSGQGTKVLRRNVGNEHFAQAGADGSASLRSSARSHGLAPTKPTGKGPCKCWVCPCRWMAVLPPIEPSIGRAQDTWAGRFSKVASPGYLPYCQVFASFYGFLLHHGWPGCDSAAESCKLLCRFSL